MYSVFNARVHSVFSKLFTQIDAISNGNKKNYEWTPEDIASAIALRSVYPKAYRYLREKRHFPLPDNLSFTLLMKLNKECKT